LVLVQFEAFIAVLLLKKDLPFSPIFISVDIRLNVLRSKFTSKREMMMAANVIAKVGKEASLNVLVISGDKTILFLLFPSIESDDTAMYCIRKITKIITKPLIILIISVISFLARARRCHSHSLK